MGEDLKPAMLTLAPGLSFSAPICRPLLVGKAPLNSPPTKQVTESQQSLTCFLAKKRERYKSKLNTSSESNGRDGSRRRRRSSGDSSQCSVHVSQSAPVQSCSSLNHLHESKCIMRIASFDSQTLYGHTNGGDGTGRWTKAYHTKIPEKDPNAKTTPDDFVKLGSEELADRVVSRARLRRRNKKRTAVIHREVTRPVIKLNHQRPPGVVRTSTPLPLSSSNTTPSQSPSKKEQVETKTSNLSLSKSQDGSEVTRALQPKAAVKKVVFLSEKQSGMSKETGVPNVPPSTPRTGIKMINFLGDLCCVNTPNFPTGSIAECVKVVSSLADVKVSIW